MGIHSWERAIQLTGFDTNNELAELWKRFYA
jgi:hypothetical protein